MKRKFVLWLIAWSPFTASLAQSPTSPEHDLLGAWRLVSVETVRPNGEIIYPYYGKNPQGMIVYDSAGWMSVQIVSDPKPTVPTANSRDAFRNSPAREKAIAADGYYAYFGTFSVDVAASTVTHHLKESLYPGERGENFVRHFSIVDGHLTLIGKVHEMGEDHQRRLIWRRLTNRSDVSAVEH